MALRFADVTWLTVEDVDAAHDLVLAAWGGSAGVLNRGMIESAIAAPQSGYYDTLAELAAVYAHGIAKNHGYQDANKRTAAEAMAVFLSANGVTVRLDDEWPAIIEGVADGSVSREQLTQHIVTKLMNGADVAIEP